MGFSGSSMKESFITDPCPSEMPGNRAWANGQPEARKIQIRENQWENTTNEE